MPSGCHAWILIYNVRTQICLPPRKKISRLTSKITTWESRLTSVWFCVADRHQSPPRKFYYGAALNPTNVASQLLSSRHRTNQHHERVRPFQPGASSSYLQSSPVCCIVQILGAALSGRTRLGYQDKARNYQLRVQIHYGRTIRSIVFTGENYPNSIYQYCHGVPMSIRGLWQDSRYIGFCEGSL